MKTQEKYGSKLINMIFLTLTIVSFMNLRVSIQVERENQNKKGYQTFVSNAVLPSTPRIIKMPKATVKKTEVKKRVVDTSTHGILATYTGNISHYAADCHGCTGITASGRNIRNGNIYYQDPTYGTVRIVAGDSAFAFGTIIRTTIGENTTLAIVLDRGGIGFGRKYLFDLLCESEAKAYQLGVIHNAKIEVLRNGF